MFMTLLMKIFIHSQYLYLFKFSELALYALDVYYNQTYVSGATSFDKVDTNTGDNIYDNLYPPNSQSNNIYGDYPPYYDYFHGTYRKFSSKWKDLDKILDWIQIASET